MRCASRVNQALLDEIEAQSRKHIPIMEVCRRVGAVALDRGLTPPSYERVRTLVHEVRRLNRYQSTAGVFVDVALRAAPPDAPVEHLSGARRRRR